MLTPWQTGFESWSCVSVLSNKGKLGINASLSWKIFGGNNVSRWGLLYVCHL